MEPLLIEISPGELLDRLTILRIRVTRTRDRIKVAQVEKQLENLKRVAALWIPDNATFSELTEELQRINSQLWDVEDALRACEARGDFSHYFVGLARSVYRLNDLRSQVKQRVNGLLKSAITEEKQYGEKH
jgi:hypothetical protein